MNLNWNFLSNCLIYNNNLWLLCLSTLLILWYDSFSFLSFNRRFFHLFVSLFSFFSLLSILFLFFTTLLLFSFWFFSFFLFLLLLNFFDHNWFNNFWNFNFDLFDNLVFNLNNLFRNFLNTLLYFFVLFTFTLLWFLRDFDLFNINGDRNLWYFLLRLIILNFMLSCCFIWLWFLSWFFT